MPQLVYLDNGATTQVDRRVADVARDVMLETYVMKERAHLGNSEFSIRSGQGQKFTSGKSFRRSTFIDIDVGSCRTNDCVMWLGSGFQSEHVGAGTTEDEIDFSVFAEVLAETRDCPSCIGIVSIGDYMALVGGR